MDREGQNMDEEESFGRGEVSIAIFWPTPGFKRENICQLWVLSTLLLDTESSPPTDSWRSLQVVWERGCTRWGMCRPTPKTFVLHGLKVTCRWFPVEWPASRLCRNARVPTGMCGGRLATCGSRQELTSPPKWSVTAWTMPAAIVTTPLERSVEKTVCASQFRTQCTP